MLYPNNGNRLVLSKLKTVPLLLILAFLSFFSVTACKATSNIKVVQVEVVKKVDDVPYKDRADYDKKYDRFRARSGYGYYYVEKTVLLDPENKIDNDMQNVHSAQQKKCQEVYNLIRKGPLSKKMNERMQVKSAGEISTPDLTVYLVNDSPVSDYKAFWPHAGSDRIVFGANSLLTGRVPPIDETLVHELTHHIDNTNSPFPGYGLPPKEGHYGNEIYETEDVAFVEGIAEYYQLLENPNSFSEPDEYRRVKEVREAFSAGKTYNFYKKSELSSEELWKNEKINALLLYELSKNGKEKAEGIDNIFYATNDGGDRTLKSFLTAYLDTYPEDANVVAEAIKKYIGEDQVIEVFSEQQNEQAELLKEKQEELKKFQAELESLRQKKEDRSIWNYILTFKWIYDPLSNDISDLEDKIKEYNKEIADLKRKIEIYDGEIAIAKGGRSQGVYNENTDNFSLNTEKSSASINDPDLITTSVGEEGSGDQPTGQGKATVNSSEW